MQYAIVDNEPQEAFAAGRGHCPVCGAVTIAKCGPRVLPHWAHKGRRHCDRWWERETVWHRQWKSLFPEDCREISHIRKNGTIHLADIKTPTGIIIKVRQATLRDAERRAREAFYTNLLWIIDGRDFRHNFDVYHALPHPHSAVARDIVWLKARRDIEDSTDGALLSTVSDPACPPGHSRDQSHLQRTRRSGSRPSSRCHPNRRGSVLLRTPSI